MFIFKQMLSRVICQYCNDAKVRTVELVLFGNTCIVIFMLTLVCCSQVLNLSIFSMTYLKIHWKRKGIRMLRLKE